jgi:ornithine decarboxylase
MVDTYNEELDKMKTINTKLGLLDNCKDENGFYLGKETEKKGNSDSDSGSTCSISNKMSGLNIHEFSKDISRISALENFINNSTEAEPFFIFNPNSIVNQHEKWRRNLPRFTPFYAVKCNNDPNVLKVMVSLGTSFDCASLEEIKTMINYGVSPENIIFANPCKAISHLKYAAEKGVRKMTFDNADELYKIKQYHPNAELIIRIHVDDSKSICQLGFKFGVPLGKTKPLLELAKELELNVIGVSFHVGSGCTDSSSYSDAIKRARDLFSEAEELGYKFNLLDIGGGFPGVSGVQHGVNIEFEEIATVINKAMDEHFNSFTDLQLIAEPGRYYTASAFSLVTHITSRRTINTQEGKSFMYYINDGVYGSFNCLIFDHAILPYPKFLIKNPSTGQVSYTSAEFLDQSTFVNCSIWGPTCDSMDCLTKGLKLPELNYGDWLIFENMGAYTLVAASRFNGMNKSKIYNLNTEFEFAAYKAAYEHTNTPSDKRAWLSDLELYS